MLEIVNYNEGEYEFPCLLVLGCFDGLHIGHAELLKKAKLQAKINGLDLGVMMFADGKGGKQVYSFEERIALLEPYNVKLVLKIEFTNDFKNTKPLDFLQVIEDKLNVKAYMSGKDFRFGAGAKGKSSTLKNYGEDEENGVWYMSVKDVLSGTDKVSTTLIKSLLENGDVARANELLGREFSLSGTAEADGTAVNVLYPENKVKLKSGSYSVKCTVGENEYCGEATVGDNLQIYLDGAENIDGQEITVKFLACGEQSETEQNIAVEELAVAEDTENSAEASEVAETLVETAEEVLTEEPAEEPAEIPAESVAEVAEDTEFEEELEEEFEEIAEEPATEEPAEPEAEADEGYTLTEIAEETEADEGYTQTELAEEVSEAEPQEEIAEEPVEEELPEEEISEEEIPEAPVEVEQTEEISEEEISEEESVEVTTEEIPDDGENNG